ncbi:hypothetical protein EOI86_16665 [Hwanghaeella grinnelliae]|uniref:Uncharacterized protein n=1 Tax=Hwanghaeella grinnelliae TaxID=2500179 RepID=A0A3S2Z829_9PROT|nr:hypothetical protein [Hwanghaeella grinnelliae]RVU36796.1 hypothetical protein EOI86_16665 [Hwanghaeella grinnelliae]
MRDLLHGVQPANLVISPSLQLLLDEGFLWRGGACLLAHFADGQRNFRPNDYQDLTGYECAVNSLHIEDYATTDVVAQTYMFVEQLVGMWNRTHTDEKARVIVTSDEGDVVVKMHTIRIGEEYLAADLEGYLDAVLEVDTTDELENEDSLLDFARSMNTKKI